MEKSFSLIKELCATLPLCWQGSKAEIKKVKNLILYSKASVMIKSFFQAIEALFRAVIYLLVLVIGVTVAGLGSYIVLFLAIRFGQFLWELIFKDAWL